MASLPSYENRFAPQRKNLSSVLRGFKSAVTVFAREQNIVFGWQERFHDHVSKSEAEYHLISNYINANILNWNRDSFFCE